MATIEIPPRLVHETFGRLRGLRALIRSMDVGFPEAAWGEEQTLQQQAEDGTLDEGDYQIESLLHGERFRFWVPRYAGYSAIIMVHSLVESQLFACVAAVQAQNGGAVRGKATGHRPSERAIATTEKLGCFGGSRLDRAHRSRKHAELHCTCGRRACGRAASSLVDRRGCEVPRQDLGFGGIVLVPQACCYDTPVRRGVCGIGGRLLSSGIPTMWVFSERRSLREIVARALTPRWTRRRRVRASAAAAERQAVSRTGQWTRPDPEDTYPNMSQRIPAIRQLLTVVTTAFAVIVGSVLILSPPHSWFWFRAGLGLVMFGQGFLRLAASQHLVRIRQRLGLSVVRGLQLWCVSYALAGCLFLVGALASLEPVLAAIVAVHAFCWICIWVWLLGQSRTWTEPEVTVSSAQTRIL